MNHGMIQTPSRPESGRHPRQETPSVYERALSDHASSSVPCARALQLFQRARCFIHMQQQPKVLILSSCSFIIMFLTLTAVGNEWIMMWQQSNQQKKGHLRSSSTRTSLQTNKQTSVELKIEPPENNVQVEFYVLNLYHRYSSPNTDVSWPRNIQISSISHRKTKQKSFSLFWGGPTCRQGCANDTEVSFNLTSFQVKSK